MSEKGRVPATAQVARPTNTSAKPPAVIGPPPTARPEPKPAADVRLLGSQPGSEEAMVLKAAQSAVSTPSPQERRYITVTEGQTLIRIAHADRLPARTIAVANHLEPPYRLKAGARLVLPEPDRPDDPAGR